MNTDSAEIHKMLTALQLELHGAVWKDVNEKVLALLAERDAAREERDEAIAKPAKVLLTQAWRDRDDQRKRAEAAEASLTRIRREIPLNSDGTADSWDGTANPVILDIIDGALKP